VARIEIGDIAPKQGVSGWTLVNSIAPLTQQTQQTQVTISLIYGVA
jgi:hypothetical protein